MRFTRFLTVYAALASALLYPSTAVAAPKVTVTEPGQYVTVGNKFTVKGTINPPNCQVSEIAYEDSNGGFPIDKTLGAATYSQNGGDFVATFDFSKPLDQQHGPAAPPEGVPAYAKAGGIDLLFSSPESSGPCAADPGAGNVTLLRLKLTYQPPADTKDDSAKKNQAPGAAPGATEASSSPSVAPTSDLEPEDEVGETKGLSDFNPWLAGLIGLLGGGVLVALAEYSAVRYYRRHPRKK